MTKSQKKPPQKSIMEKTLGVPLMIKKKKRKALVLEKLCVACGCCVKVCPRNAISVYKGIKALVDTDLCIGCGKCAKECPASVIEIREVIS